MTPPCFDQLNDPFQTPANNFLYQRQLKPIPYEHQIENEQLSLVEVDNSSKMDERELSFGYIQCLKSEMFSSQGSYGTDLSYQCPRITQAFHQEKMYNNLKENKDQGSSTCFSKLSLHENTNCCDPECNPSVKELGLYPPPIGDWKRIILKMQHCLRYLNHLGSQREFLKVEYVLEISNPYLKMNFHWQQLDKIIHHEYKMVNIKISCFYFFFSNFPVLVIPASS